jgi:hypothetical protein
VANGGDDWFTFRFKRNLPAPATCDPHMFPGSGHGWVSMVTDIDYRWPFSRELSIA